MFTGGSRLTCAVDGCDWQFDPGAATDPVRYAVPLNPTAEDMTAGITEAANKRAAKTEAVLREHAESHDVLDFLRTIHRLQQDLAQQDCGIRPHFYRQEIYGDPVYRDTPKRG